VTVLTPRGSFPKPQPADPFKGWPANGLAHDIGLVSQKINDLVAFASAGTLAARPVSAAADQTLYLATDDRAGTLYWWNAGRWYELGSRQMRGLTSLTSLPAGYTPTDRDEVIFDFVQNMSTGNRPRRWRLFYDGTPVGVNRDNNNRRWMAEGCAPLVNDATFNALVSSVAPTFTNVWSGANILPAPGRYRIKWIVGSIQPSSGSVTARAPRIDIGVRALPASGVGVAYSSEVDNFVSGFLTTNGDGTWSWSEPLVGETTVIAPDAGRVDLYAEIQYATTVLLRTMSVTVTPLELGT
jgi:hypothetical protein